MMLYYPSAPLSYALEITLACNNQCSGCANIARCDGHESLREWKALLDRIAPPDNRRRYAELIRVTGGEPTLHHNFVDIITYLDSFGVAHVTFTNGRWRNPSKVLETFQGCRNLIGLLISLHGSTADTHCEFVESSPAAFEETCETIRRATDAGIEVFTNTVLTAESCRELESIISLSGQLGASYAVFNRYLGKPHPLEPSEELLRQTILRIEELEAGGVACRLGDCIPPCFVRNSSLGSNGGIEHCAVAPNGDVRPENLTRYAFGNLFEQPIERIWQSEQAQWYRSQMPEQCLSCCEVPRCRGGCRSVMIEHGFEGDRLMKAPLQAPRHDELELNSKWKPVPYFTIRKEDFGYLLVRYNWSVPVSHDAKELIEAIDGETSLNQLFQRFGDGGLELIGHLYRQGCVEFE